MRLATAVQPLFFCCPALLSLQLLWPLSEPLYNYAPEIYSQRRHVYLILGFWYMSILSTVRYGG